MAVRPGTVVIVALLVAVIAAVAIAVVGLRLSLVRLATGSMTPTYPAESVLLVRDTPAGDVRVGDVVTVTRDGIRPITHRVVSVDPNPLGAEIVLRGDANQVDDPEPYHVARVGLVLGGIPFGGSVLAAVQSPIGLGLGTVVVAGLGVWAWWPRRDAPAHLRQRGAHLATTGARR